jgi:hypothetical protein
MMENSLTETEGLTPVVQWCLGSLQGMIDSVVYLVGQLSNGWRGSQTNLPCVIVSSCDAVSPSNFNMDLANVKTLQLGSMSTNICTQQPTGTIIPCKRHWPIIYGLGQTDTQQAALTHMPPQNFDRG